MRSSCREENPRDGRLAGTRAENNHAGAARPPEGRAAGLSGRATVAADAGKQDRAYRCGQQRDVDQEAAVGIGHHLRLSPYHPAELGDRLRRRPAAAGLGRGYSGW